MLKKLIILSIIVYCSLFFGGLSARADSADRYYNLTVEDIVVTPRYPAVNQPVKIQVRVKNSGTISLTTSQGLGFNFSFDNFDKQKLAYPSPTMTNQVAIGGYALFEYEGIFTRAGEMKMSFTIDPYNELREQKLGVDGFSIYMENDNAANKVVSVYSAGDIDLTAESLTVDKAKIVVGDILTFKAVVRNSSKSSLTNQNGLAGYDFALPGFIMTSKTQDAAPTIDKPLDPGGAFNYIFIGYFDGKYAGSTGDKKAVFKADKSNDLSEANENNNVASTTFYIFPDALTADEFAILSERVDFVSSTSAQIAWTTSKDSTAIIKYREARLYDFKTLNDNANKKEHTIVINEVTPGAKHDFQINANNGDVAKFGQMFIMNAPVDDRLAASDIAAAKAGNSFGISWKTNLLANAKLSCRSLKDGKDYSTSTASVLADHRFYLKNLPLGVYEYYISGTSTPGSAFVSDKMRFEISDQSLSPTALEKTSVTASQLISGVNAEETIIFLSGKDLNPLLKQVGKKKDSKAMAYAMKKFTEPLVKGKKVTQEQKYAVNNFIVYGTKSTQKQGVTKRVNILKGFVKNFKKLPSNAGDWKWIIKNTK